MNAALVQAYMLKTDTYLRIPPLYGYFFAIHVDLDGVDNVRTRNGRRGVRRDSNESSHDNNSLTKRAQH